ncbi:DUF1911 domain-containing protein [Chitinophaga pendula]|uniref:PoNe immunity protein domain-containing protein n=1 Tax=Chitinophaga TaxID=79328 RepID=UPI000BAF550C|nr:MULTISPECIES: PoNe immunity protein domain-containing protein [Chitinophaga]ASZ12584.1 hypothetical protein CK934_17290 [Chitinophaga sp. MD30]UCJ09813.1 DUF1911 domain-containing protein [Chitinophaga pendula]
MTFFKKLFRRSEETLCPNQRAPLKNAKYFEAMLTKQDKILQRTSATNEELTAAGKLTSYNYWALAVDYLSKIYLIYSMGKPITECYDLFIAAARLYEKSWDPDSIYPDMLDMVSLGYLLQVPDQEFGYIVQYVQQADQHSSEPKWTPDGVLWFIINARMPGGPKPTSVIWPKISQDIFAITKMQRPQAEIAMKTYLDKWYQLHSQDPWYDNHKKELCYKGYWAWEAGAVAKIMQLDDSSFKDNPYYPYELVHWTGP